MWAGIRCVINVDVNKIKELVHLNSDRKIDLTSGLFCPYIQANLLSKSSIHSIPSWFCPYKRDVLTSMVLTCGRRCISMFHQGSLYICSMSSQHQLLTRTFSISDRWALLFLSTCLFVLNRISTNWYWEVIDKDKTLREHWCTLSGLLVVYLGMDRT